MAKFFLVRWLENLINAIGKIFRKLDKEIQNNIDYVIDVVNNLKGTIDETMIDELITELIPGNKDDEAVAILREWLPPVIIELVAIRDTPAGAGMNEKLLAALNAIKISPDNTRGMFWRSIAALAVERLSDGKLDVNDAAIIAAFVYKNRKKNNA